MADVRSLLLIAAAIFVLMVFAAYLVGKCFEARNTRRAVMVGTIIVYCLAFAGYFGFIEEPYKSWADVRSLLLIAAAIFVLMVFAAYLVGKCFEARTTRRAIMVGTIIVYCVTLAGYFGFVAFWWDYILDKAIK